ncbi:hypothetical protein CDV36_013592 [Fusarium kuroshium]|uniref:Uncharacterized protein n=1 Tax=Fusarium kuroshium TaxID=2010991 RepID=A0A3M2RNF2_9HYPO|nr:hypothetical protein CDV36_013592 [Fusarium kuroshium]
MSQPNPFNTSRQVGPPPQEPDVVNVVSGTSNDNSTACAMAPPSHRSEVGQQTGNNGSSFGGHETREQDLISDQDLIDMWAEVNTSRAQGENTPITLDSSSVEDTEEEANSNEALQQNIAAGVNQGNQPFMQFLTDWAKKFSQHGLVVKVAQLEEALQSANKEKEQLGGEYKKLHLKYNTANARLREANTKLNKALSEMDEQRRLTEGGSLANPAKATDDVVRGKWKTLDYNIRALACSLAKIPPSLPLDEVAQTRLSWASGSFRRHLQDEDYREPLLHAYLWNMVNDMVFDAGGMVWGGPGIADFKNVRDHIINRIGQEDSQDHPPTCQQAAKWFAQGSNMLGHLWGNDRESVRSLANAETRRLRPFFPAHNESFDRTDKKVWDEIKAIIENAIELDQIFMGSKAIFQIHWKDESQNPLMRRRFNPETMQVICHEKELSSRSLVKIHVSPFLYKIGNADGQNYDCRMLLAKASVVCN